MKTIAATVFLIGCFVISSNGQGSNAKENFNKLSWLEGKWIRTNVKPGRTAHERWKKISPTEMRGFGVNMKGSDTVFVEKISIVIKDDGLFYVADVPENKKPVYFKFIEVSDRGFVCENPSHDFPKKIAYALEGNKLKAVVSGDGKAIDYIFEKN
jgi:Domain of unknown function (DUF6265)